MPLRRLPSSKQPYTWPKFNGAAYSAVAFSPAHFASDEAEWDDTTAELVLR
jgi:hypothetical protein